MAVEQEGIMSLPQGASDPAMQISLDDAYGAVRGGLEDASPQAASDLQTVFNDIVPMLDELEDEQLDELISLFQRMLERPAEYAQLLKQAIDQEVLEPGMLPEEHDPEILSAILAVFMEARRQRQTGNQQAQMPMPPMEMARGGIAEAARMVASKGRNGDTMLAHITPSEARMLKAKGGSGTINPETGLPEFFLKSIGRAISKTVNRVVGAVKSVVKSPIGRVLATVALAAFIGPTALGASLGTAGTAALSSGIVTAVGGGNAKDILRSAAMSYLGAPGGPVSNYVSGTIGAGAMGITNAAAASAINAGIVGTGVGLLSGQKLADAVKGGLVSGALAGGMTGLQQGFRAQVGAPAGTPGAKGPELPLGRTGAEAPGATTAGPLAPVPAGMTGPQIDDYLFNAARVEPYVAPGAAAPTAAAPGVAAPSKPYLSVYGDAGAHTGTNVIPDSGPASRTAPGMFQNMYQGAKNLYNEYISPSAIQERGAAEALAKVQAQFPGATAEQVAAAPAGSPLAKAYSSALPGTFATYGPMTAAGLGIAGLMGGFSAKQPAPSAMAQGMRGTPGEDLIRANPSRYITQNLPGVQYDQSGNIIGSTPYAPSATMNDVRVATPGVPGATYQQQPMYQPAPIAQPYNMANMYSNLFMPYSGPRYMMDGGIASLAEGGYPRRTGQISGPGTEKSDSIPAMLSDGEFVMTAKAVRGAGNGSRRAGAKKMYALMHQLERNASRG